MTKFILFILILILAIIVFLPVVIQVKSAKPINQKNNIWLKELMGKSLKNNDLPIAALLIFNDEVIGEGRHTAHKEENAHGHAVVNALSDAIRNMSYDKFMALDRHKLKLLATSEPCLMCKGALINHQIHQVEVVMPQPFKKSFNLWLKQLQFDWNKAPVGNVNFVDSMMVLHPKYPFTD